MADTSSVLHLPAVYARKMKELPTYKWWKPVVAALLAFVFFMVFMVVLEVVYGIAVAVQATVAGTAQGLSTDQIIANLTTAGTGENTSSYLGIDESDPLALANTFLSIAIMIPAIGLACKIMKIGGLRGLSSVEGGLRWKRIATLLPWALLVIVVFTAIEMGVGVLSGEDIGEVRFVPAAIIVVLIFCPLQCAAEEYMCRGFLMQTFGSWIPIVAIPVVLQALVFTIMHGYNLYGLIGVCFMGLIAGYLTIKTGGLEAGICMHSANNVMSFIMSTLFVSAQTEVEVSAVSFGVDILLNIVFLVVLYQVSKRKGYLIEDKPAAPADPAAPAAPVDPAAPAAPVDPAAESEA